MIRSLQLFFLSFLLTACGGQSGQESEPSLSADSSAPKHATTRKSTNEKGAGIIRCFAYHRFGNSSYPSTNISLEQFEAHLEFLKENDYQVLTLGKALEQMNSENGLNRKTAVLTMDDGYRSIMSGAVPLLKEYGYKATIFVCTEYVGGRNNLSWEGLKQLQKKGYEIGNHSHSHAHFLNAPSDSIGVRFKKDLERSEARFKEKLGSTPELYAYPYGESVPEMERILKERGYAGAVAQNSGVIGPGSELYALPRFPMSSFYGKPEKFAEKARMLPLPVIEEKPSTPLLKGENPPTLTLVLKAGKIDTSTVQCFVDGGQNCDLKIRTKGDEVIVRARSQDPLEDRRTLYTITAPDLEGDWHWYSKLWVRPEKEE